MNVVQTVIDRQLGLYTRVNYDCALRRLAVSPADSFYGLSNTADGPLEWDPPMFACRFAECDPHRHILALANEDGRVALQDTSAVRGHTALEGFQCHNNAVFDLAWRPHHLAFVTVSGDHTACLWDMESGTPRRVLTCCAHTRSVKTAAFSSAQPALFASGARDGRVLLWDLRAAPAPVALLPPDNCLSDCHSACAPRTPGAHAKRARARAASVTGLVFQHEHTLISCGECDGNVKVWDLRKNYSVYKREPLPKHSIPYCGSSTKNGYTNLAIDEASRRLYASCMDNVVYCYDVSTYNSSPVQRYIGHENGTFYIKATLSPDGRYLLSGSSDNNAYIWDVKWSQPVVRLAGHGAEVTCAAWCTVGTTPVIATCGDDARHKVWRVTREYLDTDEEAGLKGRAEAVPRAEMASLAHFAQTEATPTSLKRKRPNTPGTRGKVGCKSKRCLAEMLGVREPSEDPTQVTPTKRCKVESEPSKLDLAYLSPKPGPSFASPTKHEWSAKTPVSVCAREGYTPVKVSPESPKVRILTIRTPTKNLPNFVLSGEAPHLRLMSPVKQREKENVDWLTQLRAARPPPPAAAPPSPAEPPRHKAPKPPANTRTLFKYFDVTRKK